MKWNALCLLSRWFLQRQTSESDLQFSLSWPPERVPRYCFLFCADSLHSSVLLPTCDPAIPRTHSCPKLRCPHPHHCSQGSKLLLSQGSHVLILMLPTVFRQSRIPRLQTPPLCRNSRQCSRIHLPRPPRGPPPAQPL